MARGGRNEAWLSRGDIQSHALQAAGIGTWQYDPKTQTSYSDPQTLKLFGLPSEGVVDLSEAIGRIHPEDVDRITAAIGDVTEGRSSAYDEVFRVDRGDGDIIWMRGTGHMMAAPGEEQEFLFGVNYDVTREKTLEEQLARRNVLLEVANDEMRHRMKNSFAVLASMINQTSRHATSTKDLADRLHGRLMALSSAAEMAWQPKIGGAACGAEILQGIMKPYGAAVTLTGTPFELSSDYAMPFALLTHELATNALKHGSLSHGDGRLTISWKIRDGNCDLRWREEGDMIRTSQVRTGFGSSLIDGMMLQLDGTLERRWGDRGLDLQIRFRPTGSHT